MDLKPWLVLIVLGAGFLLGVMLDRGTFVRCSVGVREFTAKTVVCDDGSVYKLVPEEAEQAKWERVDKRLEALEQVIQPVETTVTDGVDAGEEDADGGTQ